MPETRTELRNSHPGTWIPVEKGDWIDGKVIEVIQAWSNVRQGGTYYPLLTIEGEAKGYGKCSLQVHAFGAVLYNELDRHRPEVGERVIITYQGEGKVKRAGRKPAQLYRVRCPDRKDEGARAYDQIFGARNPTQVEQVEQTELPTADEDGDIPF